MSRRNIFLLNESAIYLVVNVPSEAEATERLSNLTLLLQGSDFVGTGNHINRHTHDVNKLMSQMAVSPGLVRDSTVPSPIIKGTPARICQVYVLKFLQDNIDIIFDFLTLQ